MITFKNPVPNSLKERSISNPNSYLLGAIATLLLFAPNAKASTKPVDATSNINHSVKYTGVFINLKVSPRNLGKALQEIKSRLGSHGQLASIGIPKDTLNNIKLPSDRIAAELAETLRQSDIEKGIKGGAPNIRIVEAQLGLVSNPTVSSIQQKKNKFLIYIEVARGSVNSVKSNLETIKNKLIIPPADLAEFLPSFNDIIDGFKNTFTFNPITISALTMSKELNVKNDNADPVNVTKNTINKHKKTKNIKFNPISKVASSRVRTEPDTIKNIESTVVAVDLECAPGKLGETLKAIRERFTNIGKMVSFGIPSKTMGEMIYSSDMTVANLANTIPESDIAKVNTGKQEILSLNASQLGVVSTHTNTTILSQSNNHRIYLKVANNLKNSAKICAESLNKFFFVQNDELAEVLPSSKDIAAELNNQTTVNVPLGTKIKNFFFVSDNSVVSDIEQKKFASDNIEPTNSKKRNPNKILFKTIRDAASVKVKAEETKIIKDQNQASSILEAQQAKAEQEMRNKKMIKEQTAAYLEELVEVRKNELIEDAKWVKNQQSNADLKSNSLLVIGVVFVLTLLPAYRMFKRK